MAATRTPNISDWVENTSEKSPINQAKSAPASNPNNIAGPPKCGVGISCTSLIPGAEITPKRSAVLRAKGVAMKVAIAATPPTVR